MNHPLVPIRVAAKKAGISVERIRAWERRYQAVTPTRVRGGRLFSQADINRLTLLNHAVADGHSIGQVAKLSDAELHRLFGSGQTATTNPGDSQEIFPVLETALNHIRNYDAAEADQALGKLAAFLSPQQFCFEVMIPLMNMVGAAWENGSINIAQEHMMSSVMRGLVATHLRHPSRVDRHIRIVIASPEGELHEFGMLCAAILALSSGIHPVYLGPNLPTTEMIHAVAHTKASGLVLGLTPQKPFSDLVLRAFSELRGNLEHSFQVFVGGGTYSPKALEQVEKWDFQYPPDFKAFEQQLDQLTHSPDQADR